MERTYTITTSPDKDSAPIESTVTVDFDGFTVDHAMDMFFNSTSPRVAVQAALRRAADKAGSIPRKWSCRAVDFATPKRSAGTRELTPDEIEQQALALAMKDPARRAAIIARMQALGM